MYINKDTIIIGKNIVLVPYREEHVLKYHEWMKSDELQKLTASEPLTLEEEYEMQKSWLRDENKLTFIILEKEKYLATNNEVEPMVGDTNLFFATPEDRIFAEAEIMIAEEGARGKKMGWEAMLHMFLYGITKLGVKNYIVKISYDNQISQKMFINMGFTEESRSEVFREITFYKIVDDLWVQFLQQSLQPFEIKDSSF
ncbi:unnamed protein product [Brassicogethes aeneus]|uniref:N-acetyltransferase domain-containing protein n=1 Tax=Brassicogethes aeneus TaxID=1431903 RepID=A0A9P0AQ63_BRAAE|nr:unnamed protein product [Brassicogethes aeneus]